MARLESQVKRYKTAAENAEKLEEELKAEKRKLTREVGETSRLDVVVQQCAVVAKSYVWIILLDISASIIIYSLFIIFRVCISLYKQIYLYPLLSCTCSG